MGLFWSNGRTGLKNTRAQKQNHSSTTGCGRDWRAIFSFLLPPTGIFPKSGMIVRSSLAIGCTLLTFPCKHLAWWVLLIGSTKNLPPHYGSTDWIINRWYCDTHQNRWTRSLNPLNLHQPTVEALVEKRKEASELVSWLFLATRLGLATIPNHRNQSLILTRILPFFSTALSPPSPLLRKRW
jgi:uncharacterized membrane protein YqaE (UPF0057 family)